MHLKIAGYVEAVRLTDKEEENIFQPLLNYIVRSKERIDKGRFLIGISGIPASGKTVFAELLKHYINSRKSHLRAQTVYLNGFHLPQEILHKRKIKSVDGSLIPLIRRKGSPWIYDVIRAKRIFKDLKGKESLSLLEYDRTLHEPVKNRIRIGPEHNIILIEGNYLFYEKGLWKGFKDIFHLKLFIDIPLTVCCAKIIARHVKGGMTFKQARDRYIENDYPNSVMISATKREADIIIKKNMRHRYSILIIKHHVE